MPDTIQLDDLNLCRCGRSARRVHCAFCGSSQVLARAREADFVTRPNGDVVKLRIYRCRVCGSLFNDDDWKLRCGASAPRTNAIVPEMRPQKELVNPKALDFTQVTPEGIQRALAKIRKMHGIPDVKEPESED